MKIYMSDVISLSDTKERDVHFDLNWATAQTSEKTFTENFQGMSTV